MKIPTRLFRPAIAGALVSLVLTGCASERAKAQAKKERENKDQYVDYYPTGSNVAIRIPKDQAKTTQAETDDAQRAFRDAQRAGTRPETGPTNGIPGANASTGGK